MKAGHPCGDACGMQRSCSSPTKPPTHSARDEQPDAADVKLPPSAKILTTAPASSRLTTAASLARPIVRRCPRPQPLQGGCGAEVFCRTASLVAHDALRRASIANWTCVVQQTTLWWTRCCRRLQAGNEGRVNLHSK